MGYSSWGRKELDMTERLIHTYTYTHTHVSVYIYIYTHTHTYIYTHTHIHTHTYIHIYIYIYTHTHTYIHTYITESLCCLPETTLQYKIKNSFFAPRNESLDGEPSLDQHVHKSDVTFKHKLNKRLNFRFQCLDIQKIVKGISFAWLENKLRRGYIKRQNDFPEMYPEVKGLRLLLTVIKLGTTRSSRVSTAERMLGRKLTKS